MKYLTVCNYAHSRSVAMCRYLHNRGQEAVAVGCGTAPSAFGPMSEWADKIVLMEPGFVRCVPESQRHKVVVIDVGHDRWSNPYSPDLAALIERLADAAKLVPK